MARCLIFQTHGCFFRQSKGEKNLGGHFEIGAFSALEIEKRGWPLWHRTLFIG
jgi:hypothetical protein